MWNWFQVRGFFSRSDGSRIGKNVIIFVADISSSMHVDKNKKFSLILGESQMLGSDDTKLTTEEKYAINFTG